VNEQQVREAFDEVFDQAAIGSAPAGSAPRDFEVMAPPQLVLRAGGGWWMIAVVECFASWRTR
jgi:hypothetical protein